MKENLESLHTIKKYLLGDLRDEAELRRIEERILLSDDFNETLLIAEDDLIEEYLDDGLTKADRERFNRFFCVSPERRKKIQLIGNLRKYAAQSASQKSGRAAREKHPSFFHQLFHPLGGLRLAAFALILCGIGFGVWRIGFYESDTDQGLARLRAVYISERPFESRLSSFNYAPFSSTRGNNNPTAETVARDGAERKLLDAAQNEPGAKSFHALGNYYLTEKQFEKAFAQYDSALKLDANNARLHNDYGVALLEKAKQTSTTEEPGKRLENLSRAYGYFTKAVELNGSLLEAFFNKAVTLQQMNQPEQTRKAWRDYLEKDASSPWADEARKNLQRLEAQGSSAKTPPQVLQDFLIAYERRDEERAWQIVSQTREMITDTMVFFQLTRNFLAGDAADQTEQSEKFLAAMQFVGKLEKEKAGDLYFAELADFYASTDRPTRRLLSQAQNQIKSGYLLSQTSKYTEAMNAFRQAGDLFAKTGNVREKKLAEYWLGFLNDRTGEVGANFQEVSALKDYCYEKKYKWLATQTLGWLAEAALAQNEYSKALGYMNAAVKITGENSDTYKRQKILAQLGAYYSQLGEPRKALIQVEESLAADRDYFSSDRQFWRSCLSAAEILYHCKLYDAAISFGQEALYVGDEKITEATANHTSYYTLALLYGGSQRYAEALDFARRSLLSAQSAKEEDRRLLRNFSLLQTAHLYRQSGDCGESLKIYSAIIEETALQGTMQLELNNYEAHKGQLLCYFALNQENLIAAELPVVLDLYEKFRSEILEEQSRNTFFDNEQSVYDLAINFEHSRNNARNAFETAETSKARSLLNLFQTETPTEKNGKKSSAPSNRFARPLSFDEIQKRLPERAQVVQYAVLSDKILIWVMTRTQFSVVERKITSVEIGDQVANYLKSIAENKLGQSDNAEARQLYETLIAPILPFLDPTKEICFVPDKSLYRLPFAALVSPVSNRFLIEDFTVFSAPSATLLVLSSESAVQKSGEIEEKLLSIGNPSFDKQEFPDLPDLPDAEREAGTIAAYYQNAEILTGSRADQKAVSDGLAGISVFHFAGHYAVNEVSPLRSKFLLAQKKDNQSADIEVGEILEKNLHSIKLAVLSACRTGIENYYDGEGMIGVSRSFLADGVPLVVASQWAVDSDATAELMIKFHSHRRQNRLSSAKALRRAQTEMLNGGNQRFKSPYYWAGFLPIGGYTNY